MDSIMQVIRDTIYFLSLPKMTFVDVLEIIIISTVLYHIILWVRKTRAWNLLKGIAVLLLCYLMAYFLNMNVILWIFNKTLAIGITALAVVFQPELRKALEELGRKNFVTSLIPFEDSKDKEVRFSDRSINEIVKATVELAKAKTGALIILEKDISLAEYERTGITIDSAISSQLLINIFEHNTPLHDGAVLIRNNRIVSATCYLPLSDNLDINKSLGTRHRAAIGVSEVSDSITVIVSEETGAVSLAHNGMIYRGLPQDKLVEKIEELSKNEPITKRMKWWKGLGKHEKSNS